MSTARLRKSGAVLMVAALSLLLSACLLAPGKFTSALDVRKDGRFTFSYTGEIMLMPLTDLGELSRKGDAAEGEFTPSPCYADDSGEERDCAKPDLDQQKTEWEDGRRSAAERKKRDADMAKAMLGGIDPSDPKAAEEFAARLRKQAGWKRVDYKGKGLFDVDFAIAGRLDHDFAFPTIERFPNANSFIQLVRRADGSLRIDAPGFADDAGSSSMLGMARMGAMSELKDGERPPSFPALDGRFTLTTDAAILANNTDDGPKAAAGGQLLEWVISRDTKAGPMGLLRMGQ